MAIIIQGSGAGSTLRDSNNNNSNGACSTVAGGSFNRANKTYSTVLGGFKNTNISSGATIGGGQLNTIGDTSGSASAPESFNTTIIGGVGNKSIEGNASFIGGGSGNTSNGLYNTILGGVLNINIGGKQQSSVIGGGCQNTTTNSYTIIGGGYKNTARGVYSTVVGGVENFTCNSFGVIMGGNANKALGCYNFIGGGRQNTTNNCQITLGGGCLNTALGNCSVIGGGFCNTISTISNNSSIIGGQINKINSELSIIGGGINNETYGLNSVIGGGRANITNGDFSSVLGGRANTASGYQSSVLGGFKNTASGINSAIFSLDSWVTGNRSVVLGGQNLSGPNDDTVYVPGLNISFLGTNTSINNLGIDIDGNVVVGDSSTNNFAVDGLLVEGSPSILGVFVPDQFNLNATKLENGSQQILTNVIYDDLSAYNSSTGVWTCPLTGRYNLSFFIHLSDPLQGWLTSVSPAPTVGGALVAGLVNFITGEIYASNSFLASVPQLYADINGASWGIELTTGDQICLKIMNTTGISYTPQVGDYLRFSLQKIG
jgi:hypothetical protein